MTMRFDRREILGFGAILFLGQLSRPAMANITASKKSVRWLSFENTHTGEKLCVDYWMEGRYIPQALQEIDHNLRDFRTGEVHRIDPTLLDLLHSLREKLESAQTFQVISGFRSPATNARLHAANAGVATKSLHMDGLAIDIRLPGRALDDVHKAALDLQLGGVGYYPTSDFVHVDTGRIRRWRGK